MTERPRDEIWDALEERFGPVPSPSGRGLRNAAVRELREANATPEQIGIAFVWCQKSFGDTFFTEMAVAKYFGRALFEWSKPVESSLSVVRRMAEDG